MYHEAGLWSAMGVKDRVFERLLGGGVDEPDGGVWLRFGVGCETYGCVWWWGVKDRVFERLLWKVDQLDDGVRRRLVRSET
jgi:hypothetical protein